MTVVSPCVWDEIFIIQVKGKNGIWMANGVERTDYSLFMLPHPFSILSALFIPWEADPRRLHHLDSVAHGFCVLVSQCRRLEHGREAGEVRCFPTASC